MATATIDLKSTLESLFLQRKTPQNKPHGSEAELITVLVANTKWTDVDEVYEVLSTLFEIIMSDEVMYRDDGTLGMLMSAALTVAKQVENLAAIRNHG